MNHSVDKVAPETIASEKRNESRPTGGYLVVAAMLAYSLLLYGNLGERMGAAATLLAAVTTFFFAMYIYYGIARLAYQRFMIIVILMRLFGGELLKVIADNGLAILVVYYCVAGLALMEYYLRKLRVSRLMKTLFYIFLFLTQLAGFFVAALVGFVDSFADWRKVHPREVT